MEPVCDATWTRHSRFTKPFCNRKHENRIATANGYKSNKPLEQNWKDIGSLVWVHLTKSRAMQLRFGLAYDHPSAQLRIPHVYFA